MISSIKMKNNFSINLSVERGKAVAFVGSVGSGKSSILSAMLGEMIKIDGTVTINGNIAYVPQNAWIMNATLRENILFGKDFEQVWYDEVVEACALKTDFGKIDSRKSYGSV